MDEPERNRLNTSTEESRPQSGVDSKVLQPATLVARAGLGPSEQDGMLNTAVYRASTIVYPTVQSYKDRHDGFYDDVVYGLYGTKTTYALARAVQALEGANSTLIVSSGTAANAISMSTFVESGDHLLVADCVYGTTRKFADNVLTRFGVEVSYFDPGVGADIKDEVRPNTRAIFIEAPGSQLFEMIDVPAIVEVARKAGVITLMDNTWASPLHFRPLDVGIDVSIQAGTKYLSGHSDVMLGTISASKREHYELLKDMAGRMGNCAGPDECYLVHRGLRTLDVRMDRHVRNAAILVDWLLAQPEVSKVLYPALEVDPGYALWKRDFKGASGLFGVRMRGMSRAAEDAFFNHLNLFKMGSSWGGYESLIVPAWPLPQRSRRSLDKNESLLRVHAGLEDPADLIDDLNAAFVRMRRAV